MKQHFGWSLTISGGTFHRDLDVTNVLEVRKDGPGKKAHPESGVFSELTLSLRAAS